MKKLFVIAFMVMLASTVFGLFHIQNKVKNLKKDLVEIHRQLSEDKAVIHVLKAEWAYLNEPTRIQKLANEHLNLEYTKVAQLKESEKIRGIYLAGVKSKGAMPSRPQLRPTLSSY
jgi:cell division protein FtsL